MSHSVLPRVSFVRAALIPAALLGAVTLTTRAQAQAPVAYVYLRGSADTIGVEYVKFGVDKVNGTLVMRGQPRIEWEQAHTNHVPGVLRMRLFKPESPMGSEPEQVATFQVRGDSAYVEITAGEQSVKRSMPTQTGAVPLVNSSVLHASFVAAHARIAKKASVPLFLTAGAQTMAGAVTVEGDTTVFVIAGTSARTVNSPVDYMPQSIVMPSQGLRVIRSSEEVISLSATRAKIDYSAPASAPYTAENVTIPTVAGITLAGTLTKPKGVTGRMPVVITISGSGQQDRDERNAILPDYVFFREIADTLGKRGIAVLRYDDRGAGESGGRETVPNATSADYAADVRAVIAWLRTRDDIDPDRIALAGHSEGGMIAPMVATADPKIRAIALLAGNAWDGRRVLTYQNKQVLDGAKNLTKAQRDSLMATIPAQLDAAGKQMPWLNFFMSHDPLAVAKNVKQPVLVLQGLTDTQVTPEQADELSAAIKKGGNSKVTLKKFPNTNHLFLADSVGVASGYAALKDSKVRREVLGTLADWFVKELK